LFLIIIIKIKMDKLLIRNIQNAKFVIAGFFAAHTFYWFALTKPKLQAEVFGWDGNGGKMLKIITDLTDEEMARLKYVRRLAWHWKGSRQLGYGRENISDQELSDRGINIGQEPYVEYVKRPPHDKYL
jgi:hypothetical protein